MGQCISPDLQTRCAFEIKGTDARVVYLKGLDLSCRGQRVSLLEQNPLRWSIEAASPIVGSGRSPGVDTLQIALHIEQPRAFTVMPIVIDGKIRAFTYADNEREPFSLEAVSQLFETCQNAVEQVDPASVSTNRKVAKRRSTAQLNAITDAGHRKLRFEPHAGKVALNAQVISQSLIEGPLSNVLGETTASENIPQAAQSETADELHIVTPDGIVPLKSFENLKAKRNILKPLSTSLPRAASSPSLVYSGLLQ